MTDDESRHQDGNRTGDLEATYERLMSRNDLAGLCDDRALEHFGKVVNLSGDLRRKEGLERVVRLSEELQRRGLSADRRATSPYFLGNAWANLRVLAGEDQSEWEQPELEREIYHLRMALRDEFALDLRPERGQYPGSSLRPGWSGHDARRSRFEGSQQLVRPHVRRVPAPRLERRLRRL
jgi:hypothetical protein